MTIEKYSVEFYIDFIERYLNKCLSFAEFADSFFDFRSKDPCKKQDPVEDALSSLLCDTDECCDDEENFVEEYDITEKQFQARCRETLEVLHKYKAS
jgi:hypothetical protein